MEETGSVGSRELQAMEYMKEHKILELLNYLTSMLLFHRPDDPRSYLISLLERVKVAKTTGVSFPSFMDHTNITSMFEILDTSKSGTISFVQYKEALKTLGLSTEDEIIKDDGYAITLEKFSLEVDRRLKDIWSSF